ncbi:MAG TPA: hypothetical protein VJV79_08090 [Polyangiaceae bacterium]|nr:hypothetical protein [Polyangiaceae bacterium]
MRIQTSFLGTLTLATLTLAPLVAHAEEVATTGKGAVGGALLGAEIVMATEAAFKVQPGWAYLVGGVGGAAAGGVGGYFIEQEVSPKATMLMLAGGMALIIPTTVAVLSATAYEPPASYTQDRAPADEPVAEPPRPTGTPTPAAAPTTTSPSGNEVTPPATDPTVTPPAPGAPTSSLPRRKSNAHRTLPLDYHLSPPALIGVSSQMLTLGVPAVEVRNVYSRNELAMYGVNQATELRVPVLNLFF